MYERRRKMLTVEEIKGIIEQAEKQKQELQELIDSLSTMEVEPGRVAKSERYWYINDAGMIRFTIDERCDSDNYRYECGNYYPTEEDAIRAEKQIRLFRLLDRFSRQNGWTDELWQGDETCKYYIYFDHILNQIRIDDRWCTANATEVYFTSESVAQQAIVKHHNLIAEVMQI